jgi:hypothetical protein
MEAIPILQQRHSDRNPPTFDYPQPKLKRALHDLLHHGDAMTAFFLVQALDRAADRELHSDDASLRDCAKAVKKALEDYARK